MTHYRCPDTSHGETVVVLKANNDRVYECPRMHKYWKREEDGRAILAGQRAADRQDAAAQPLLEYRPRHVGLDTCLRFGKIDRAHCQRLAAGSRFLVYTHVSGPGGLAADDGPQYHGPSLPWVLRRAMVVFGSVLAAVLGMFSGPDMGSVVCLAAPSHYRNVSESDLVQ